MLSRPQNEATWGPLTHRPMLWATHRGDFGLEMRARGTLRGFKPPRQCPDSRSPAGTPEAQGHPVFQAWGVKLNRTNRKCHHELSGGVSNSVRCTESFRNQSDTGAVLGHRPLHTQGAARAAGTSEVGRSQSRNMYVAPTLAVTCVRGSGRGPQGSCQRRGSSQMK